MCLLRTPSDAPGRCWSYHQAYWMAGWGAAALMAGSPGAGALSISLEDTDARFQAQTVCIAYDDLRGRGAGPDTTAESREIHQRAMEACGALDYGLEAIMRTEL